MKQKKSLFQRNNMLRLSTFFKSMKQLDPIIFIRITAHTIQKPLNLLMKG